VSLRLASRARLARPSAVVGAFVVAAALALAVKLPTAYADAPKAGATAAKVINADVMIMLATQVDGGSFIDPLIGSMPQLTKPPFSAYNNYRLLDKKSLPLETGKAASYKLVNDRVLQVTYIEETADRRHHVSAAINQPGGKAFLKLLEVKAAPNETFFVGGQSYKGGSLVLAITMRP
jgi:hypothetical protein